MIVNQAELAECLGISRRRVRQLQQDGIIQKEDGGYQLGECVQAFIEYKIKSETGRRASETKEELQAEHERVKIQISKERLRRIRRESLDAKAVEETWYTWLIYLRNQLDNLPIKIVMEIAGKNTNDQISTVEGIIKDFEKELADYNPDYQEAEEWIEEEEDEEEEDEEEDDW